MNLDEYGEVINGEATYQKIAHDVASYGSALIGWSDEEGTHFDILFTIVNSNCFQGPISGGQNARTDIFVSILRFGAFGFELNGKWKAPGYIAGKIPLGENITTDKFADLLNGVIAEIEKMNHNTK